MEFLFKMVVFLYFKTSLARRKDYYGVVMGLQSEVMFLNDSLENHTKRVGQEAVFDCKIESIGMYKVAWLHSEKGIIAVHPDVLGQHDRIKSTHDNGKSWSLVIKNVQESDAGKYICQINTATPISISGTLSVEVPPDIIDDMSSSDTLATEGMKVTLSCEATGIPRPTITWRRQPGFDRSPELIRVCNKTFDHNKNKLVDKCSEVEEFVGDVLELYNVNRFDSGIYLCIANNRVPPSVSKRVRLYVDYPPTLSVFHQLVGKFLGDNVTLECLTSGHPPPMHFWLLNNDFIVNSPGKHVITEEKGRGNDRNTFSKLTVLNVSSHDFGNYQCQAKNSMGSTNGNIKLYEIYDLTTPISVESSHISTLDFSSNSDNNEVSKGRYQFEDNSERRRKRLRKHRQRNRYTTSRMDDDYLNWNSGSLQLVLSSSILGSSQLLLLLVGSNIVPAFKF